MLTESLPRKSVRWGSPLSSMDNCNSRVRIVWFAVKMLRCRVNLFYIVLLFYIECFYIILFYKILGGESEGLSTSFSMKFSIGDMVYYWRYEQGWRPHLSRDKVPTNLYNNKYKHSFKKLRNQ